VHVAGRRLTTRSVAAKQAIGLVPQDLALYPDLTGRENLDFFGKLYGLAGKALRARIGEVLDVVGLAERAGDLTKKYSGGMKRRLNIGIGLLHQPQLLILDEPTVGVDPQSRNAILESVEQLAGQGMAVLYTTHYMEEAERLCDRVAIVDQGQIEAEGTRRQLVALVGEHDRIALSAGGDMAGAAEAARQLDGVASASAADGRIEVVADDAGAVLSPLLASVATRVHVSAVALVVVKDLRLRIRDRSAFVVGILAPFGLATILSLVVGGVIDDVSADVAIVDRDGGDTSGGLVDAVESIPEVDVVTGLSEDEARDQVDADSLQAAIVIPDGFGEATESLGETPELRVVGNVDDPLATQIAQAVAEGFGDRVDAVRLSVATALAGEGAGSGTEAGDGTAGDTAGSGSQAGGGGGGGEDLDGVIAEAREQTPPVVVDEDTASERQLDTSTYLVAGVSVLFLFFLVQFGVRGLLEERDQGTLPRLLAAPTPRFVVPLAKALVSVVLGLFALAVLVVASTLVLGAHWGDPLAVAVLSVAVVLAAISIMGVVVVVARTSEQADNIQTIIAMVLGVLGGSFFPVSMAQGLTARLATFTPHHWYLTGLGEAAAGGVGDVVGPTLALLAFALVLGGIGAVLMARRGIGRWMT
jgi:linearmycin/streptolysin S transport system ATP-binding protein